MGGDFPYTPHYDTLEGNTNTGKISEVDMKMVVFHMKLPIFL